MDDAMKELGRRAIAADFGHPPGSVWRDTDGRKYACMRSNGEGRAIMQPMDGGWSQCVSANDNGWMAPDFSDPATLGCLLAQVRERWEDRGLSVCGIYEAGVWVWMFNEGKPHGASFYRARSVRQPSEAAALVAALEAAPKAAP